MSGFVTIEVCNDGTITRACARAINRAMGTKFSGTSDAVEVSCALAEAGAKFRVVDAASLAGADKGRHTREVNRSQAAQVRRGDRAIVAALECDDEAIAKLFVEYAAKRVAA